VTWSRGCKLGPWSGLRLETIYICDLGFGVILDGIGDVILGLIQNDLCREGFDIWRWGCEFRLYGL
jgi:hypothetical protein